MIIYICMEDKNVIGGWSSTRMSDSDIEIEIQEGHEFLDSRPRMFKYIDGEIIKDDSLIVNKIRDRKIRELNADCNKTILGRFQYEIDGEVYHFSNDMEAQSNFEKADRAFEKGRFTEVSWTCYDNNGSVQRVSFTKETFETLYIKHLEHIQYNISKFRDILMPQVNNAQTIEEIESIVWQ